MRVLAAHHVARPHLVRAILGSPVAAVVAGGGYGKTSLLHELATGHDTVVVVSLLGDGSLDGFRRATARAARQSGLDDLAERLQASGDMAHVIAAAMSERSDPVAVAVDDVEIASEDTAAVLARLAIETHPPHGLIVAGRALPGELPEVLDRLPHLVRLDTGALALTVDETAQLLRGRLGVTLGDGDVAALHRATAGWPAAVVLAGSSHRSADDETGGDLQPGALLARLVDQVLGRLTPADVPVAVQLAHLPLVDADIAVLAGGQGALDRLQRAGLPFTMLLGGWCRIAGPVAELLTVRAPLDPAVATQVADRYLVCGETSHAVEVLLAAGLADDAARFLADLPGPVLDALDESELIALVRSIPEDARRRHPRILVEEVRALLASTRYGEHSEALSRLSWLEASGAHRTVALAADAERAYELVMTKPDPEAARGIASRVAASGDADPETRVRAKEALGRAIAAPYDTASLLAAEPVFEEALVEARRLGRPSWHAQAAVLLGKVVRHYLGRADRALESYDEALSVTRPGSRQHGAVLIYRGEALCELGRSDDLAATTAELVDLGERLGDPWLVSAAAWLRATSASQQGDAETTLRLHAEIENRPGDWLGRPIATFFFCDATEHCVRVDRPAAARRHLERARAQLGVADEWDQYILQAEAFYEARYGEPREAIDQLDRLQRRWAQPRDEWRRRLFRALAMQRAGLDGVGAEAATALEAAAALGIPGLAVTREAWLVSRLAPTAADAGSVVAATLPGSRPPVTVRALGEFSVALGGRPVELPPGRPADVVRLVIAAGGRLPVDSVVEGVWPGTTPERGRRALRNALHRLPEREALVVRDGDELALAPGVEVDALSFERDAQRVRALLGTDPAAGVEEAARLLAGYRGELLPADFRDLVAVARARLRRTAGEVTDAAVAAALRLGRPEAAVRLLRQALPVEPENEARHVALARVLLDLGRPMAATAALGAARREAARLGVPVGEAVQELEAEARGRGAEGYAGG